MNHPIHAVKSARVTGASRIVMTFKDGLTREVDLGDFLWGELYGPLRDPDYFAQVKVDGEVGTVVWPNGADFDPATLHDWPEQEAAWRERAERWRAAAV